MRNTAESTHDLSKRRAAVLSELVRLFSAGKDPIGLAEAAVELVARATGALSVFVYFWHPDVERLVLEIVSRADSDRGFENVGMRLGEGITGWSGLHQKPVVIHRNIRDDPRFLELPGVEEEPYRSMIAVPIHDEERLFGVFAMYSDREEAFSEPELVISEEVGLLLASGLKRAENVKELEITSATARFLTDLPPGATSSTAAALQESAHRVLSLMNADMCVIDYVPLIGMNADPVIIAERIDGVPSPRVRLTHSKKAIREQQDRYEINCDRISVALGFSTSRGILTCYRQKRFAPAETSRLHVLATQIGVLLETVRSGSTGSTNMVRLLVSNNSEELSQSLRRIGWRGAPFQPVLVNLLSAGLDAESLARQVRNSISANLSSEIPTLGSGNQLLVLAPAGSGKPDHSLETVHQWLQDLTSQIDVSLAAGIGDSTSQTTDIATSIKQARQALAWAQFHAPEDKMRIVDYRDVQSVSSLPGLVTELAPALASMKYLLNRIAKYDEDNGTELVHTVREYAAHGGSTVDAARSLFIHRNTMRQRVSRIETMLDCRLQDLGDWTEILLATRLLEEASR